MKSLDEVNKPLRDALELILPANLGAVIQLDGVLYIRQLESLDYAVGMENDSCGVEDWEEVMEDLTAAIDLFISKRNELEIGMDFMVRACEKKFGVGIDTIPLNDGEVSSVHYDEGADVFYVTLLDRKCFGEEIAPGVIKRMDLEDPEIVGGYTFIGFKGYHCKLDLCDAGLEWGLPDAVIAQIALKAEALLK